MIDLETLEMAYSLAKELYERYKLVKGQAEFMDEFLATIQEVTSFAQAVMSSQSKLKQQKEGSPFIKILSTELKRTTELIKEARQYLDKVDKEKGRHTLIKMLTAKKHKAKCEEFTESFKAQLTELTKATNASTFDVSIDIQRSVARIITELSEVKLESKQKEEKRQHSKQVVKLEQTAKHHHQAAMMLEKKQDASGANEKYKQAVSYYEQAIAAGSVKAKSALGGLLIMGKTGEKDIRRAVKLWQESAEKGYHRSIYNLAEVLFKGKGASVGIEKDQTAAMGLYVRSAVKGNKYALNALLQIAKQAEIITEPGALFIFARAVETGLEVGPLKLAPNPSLSKQLYEKAAGLGDEQAKEKLIPFEEQDNWDALLSSQGSSQAFMLSSSSVGIFATPTVPKTSEQPAAASSPSP